ncbi:hypothetical protein D3C73_1427350 [compost metagenome]
MHPTRLVQLPDTSVNNRVTGIAIAPGLKFILVIAPFNFVVLLFKRIARRIREVPKNGHVKLAPGQFRKPDIRFGLNGIAYSLADT